MYLGIDYGKKRIGLSLGQTLPYGAGIIDGSLGSSLICQKIKEICDLNEVVAIVIGMPIRSQGEPGTLSSEIKDFGDLLLKHVGLPVYFEPEQFTTTEAEAFLRQYEKKTQRKKGVVDELSAILILEQFLNDHKSS